MKIINIFFVFFIFVANANAFTTDELEKVMVYDNIKGSFQQKKIITGFPNSITTQGKFFIKNMELFWNTEKPRQNSLKINADGIYSLSKNNEWIKIQNQYDKSLFLDIINMNFKKINSLFSINLTGDQNSWNMYLKPKTHIAGKIFKAIIIKGNIYVSNIEIEEENGDKTLINFFNVTHKEKE